MPRPHTPRPLAQPRTGPQRERVHRILRAAAALGARDGLDLVQMADVAARAGVSLGTLYRYFPSKHSLFASLLLDQVHSIDVTSGAGLDPPQAVATVLRDSVAALGRAPALARAMLVSVNAVRADDETFPAIPLDQTILAAARLRRVTPEDQRLARLMEQCLYGILTWAAAGQISPDQAADDVTRACVLLLAPWRHRARQEADGA